MDTTNKKFTYFINLSFFLYFIILLTERVISIVLSFVNHVKIYENAFDGYVYTLMFLSIVCWLIYLLIYCRNNIKALFKPVEDISFKYLIIASGILLLSGMVHSEYTIPVIQFISYGILIIGILLKVIMINKTSNNRPLLWLSFIYLVALSMAIPVMYRSFIEQYVFFHILEAIASFVLVGVFTYLFLLIFSENDDLFIYWTLLLVIALDTPLIILRWKEEINYFVLIFESITVILFIVGYIHKQKKRPIE